MPLNVSQAPGDADQLAGDDANMALRQDARALQGQLHSALDKKAETNTPSAYDLPPVIEQTASEASSFGRAVASQADQIQYLIEQINRLDSDTQLAELRGVVRALCDTLNDVVLQTKQGASDVAKKIDVLAGAVAIIGGAPDIDAPHDLATVLAGAITTAERMLSLEGLLQESRAAIAGLEENASRGQRTVRDLSAALAELKGHAWADQNEIASLHRRIELTDQSLAQGLVRVDNAVESDRNEIVRLRQQVGSTDRASVEGLAALGERAAALCDEMGRIRERVASVEGDVALHAGFQENIQGLSRRLEDAEHRTATDIESWKLKDMERFAAMTNRLESLEQTNSALRHDAEQMVARLQAAERTIATMTQSQKALSIWQDRLAQVLAGPQLPEG
jgi:chromosome segregation ATPase